MKTTASPEQQEVLQRLAQLAAPIDYQRIRLPLFDGGLRTDIEPTDLQPNQVVDILNLLLVAGKLQVDTGYFIFGTLAGGQTFFGTVQDTFQIYFANGTTQELLLTTATVYGYVPTLNQWQLLTTAPAGTYSNTAQINAGGNSFTANKVAVAATGSLVFTGNPIANDTIDLAGTIVTFVTSGASGNQVNLGGSTAATLTNLLSFASGSSDPNIVKMTYAVVGSSFNCTAVTAGPAGNNLALSATTVNLVITAPPPKTLQGGSSIINGSYLGLPLQDGEQLVVTVTGVVGTTVSFTPAIPAGDDVPINSNIALGIKLAGATTNQPCFETFAPNDFTFITNGIDPVFYYDGGQLHFLYQNSDLPSTTICQWIIVFHESLLLINTVEAGVSRPQRVRGSDVANPLSWTPAPNGGPPTSLAQIYDLLDTEDFILHAEAGGPYIILYRDTTIMRGTFYGLQSEYIFWEYMVFGEGVAGEAAVTTISADHAFVGQTSIYEYGFGYDIQDTGQGVYVALLSAVGDLIPQFRNTIFLTYVGDYDELWVLYPSSKVNPAAQVPNKLLRKNLTREAWYIRLFANEILSASPYLPQSTTTWASAVGTWAQQTAVWNSRIFQANVPIFLLCAPDTNKVYAYDYTSPTDAGAVIDWSVTSKDISPAGSVLWRWDQIRIFGTGNNVTVNYSLDGGNTFVELGVLNFGTNKPTMQYLTMNAVSEYIRVQLTGNDPTFTLVWIEVWALEESEY